MSQVRTVCLSPASIRTHAVAISLSNLETITAAFEWNGKATLTVVSRDPVPDEDVVVRHHRIHLGATIDLAPGQRHAATIPMGQHVWHLISDPPDDRVLPTT